METSVAADTASAGSIPQLDGTCDADLQPQERAAMSLCEDTHIDPWARQLRPGSWPSVHVGRNVSGKRGRRIPQVDGGSDRVVEPAGASQKGSKSDISRRAVVSQRSGGSQRFVPLDLCPSQQAAAEGASLSPLQTCEITDALQSSSRVVLVAGSSTLCTFSIICAVFLKPSFRGFVRKVYCCRLAKEI